MILSASLARRIKVKFHDLGFELLWIHRFSALYTRIACTNGAEVRVWNKITFTSFVFLIDPSAQEAFTETDAVFKTASV